MLSDKNNIVVFLIVTTAIILLLAAFVITLLYLYQKRQLIHLQKINALKLDHEKGLMATQLEIQESTFQHISREIHDNITLSLSLSKLHLNTLNMFDERDAERKITSSIELISKSIEDLRQMSMALNTDMIKSEGLLNALKNEIDKLHSLGVFTIDTQITGEPVFMDTEKELMLFRIVQETFNNIIRHSEAKIIKFMLRYYENHVDLIITDDGKGFEYPEPDNRMKGSGLNNIRIRTHAVNGKASIFSAPGEGTSIHISIPYQYESRN